MSQEVDQSKERTPSKLWVPFVLFIGAVLGVLNYVLISPEYRLYPIFFGIPLRELRMFELYQAFHIILSTIGICLLIALIVVYANSYSKTRANFMLGILVVLFALLLQAILNYPLFLDYVEGTIFQYEFSSPIADVFMIVAYTVFLYLSLE